MGPITGYGIYNGGYGGRSGGSSGPKDTVAASKVRDYATADAYLGKKVDRPLRYATRLRRVERPRYGKETVGATSGIAVVHHGTAIVVWRKDGLTEFLAYNSVTTKARLNSYLPISIGSDRGNLAVWPNMVRKKDGSYTWEPWPKTPRRIMKCRQCSGRGKHGPSYCYGHRYSWGREANNICDCGYYKRRHQGRWYWAHDDYGKDAVTCENCKGLGRVDVGSRPIPYLLQPGAWYLVADGRLAGHLGDGSRWSKVALPHRIVARKKDRRVAGEIVAYRGWRANDGLLQPLGINAAPYESFNLPAAQCLLSGSQHVMRAPYDGCSCGYWAMKKQDAVPTLAQVFGAVRIWGTVIEHEIGYRAQYMAVDYLVTDSNATAAALVTRYRDVPVYVASWPCKVDELEPYTLREVNA